MLLGAFFGPAAVAITAPLSSSSIPKVAERPTLVLKAKDGVSVYAQQHDGPNPGAPIILLFHQAGSSKSEYAPIAPLLNSLGLNALAIDQRVGGELFEPPNETVEHLEHSATNYLQALPDMEAALSWAQKSHPKSRIYLWGSSYSSALVFLLAARHPKSIAALIAFSPAEYLDDKDAVHRAARRLHMPVFVDSAADPNEIEAARSILGAVRSKRKKQHVPRKGIHGSSTLRLDRDPDGAEENWAAVSDFLKSLEPAARK